MRIDHVARRRRVAITLLEVMFVAVMLSALLGAAYVFMTSGATQRKQVEGYLDLQRDVRRAVRILERDVRGLLRLKALELGLDNQLKTMDFEVPVDEELTGPVRYGYDAKEHTLSRNGEELVKKSVADFQVWVFDPEGAELKTPESYADLHRIRIRLEIEATGGAGRGENRRRVIDLAIVPRIPAARYKGQVGRLNLQNNRFLKNQVFHRPRTNVGLSGADGE